MGRKAQEIKYLSPSSLSLWEKDRAQWAERYIARFERDPQTPAMAVGTWFDILVKERIAKDYGIGINIESLYSTIENNDERARVLGHQCFDHYINSGAYASLVKYFRGEIQLEGDITSVCYGVPLRGKPDLTFLGPGAKRAILDWKVNGVYGRAQSPNPNYVDSFPARKPHKNAVGMLVDGVIVDLDDSDPKRPHKDQLMTYDWLSGGTGVGLQLIDQITQNKSGLRTTRTAYFTTQADVDSLIGRYQGMWEALQSGRVFTDLSLEDDLERQRSLMGPIGDKLL